MKDEALCFECSQRYPLSKGTAFYCFECCNFPRKKTMPKKKLEVIKDPENVVTIKIFEQAIVDISKAMKAMRSGRLGDRAIVLLIQDAVGVNAITKVEIRSVLDAIRDLEKLYLK